MTEFPKHHPAGLWVLFTTEMWERFCYYGMRAFLTLYLCSTAMSETNPGMGWTQSEAYNFYGNFTALVYLMPLLCGWIADYFIGQHRSMIFGGILIALGEFTLCATEFVRNGTAGIPVTLHTDPVALFTFYAGLVLIIIGTGFFKPCVSVMVGQLYGDGDPRRDGAFTIFYMGINLGAMLSPFIAGTIAEKVGWEWGFFVAGIGMIFGLCTYTFWRPKYLAHLGLPPQKADKLKAPTPEQIELAKKDEYERTRPLTRVDYDKIYVILAMSLFTIAFWLSFEQAGSSLNVFAKKSTDRNIESYDNLPKPAKRPLLENEFAIDLGDSLAKLDVIRDDAATILETRKIEDKKRIRPFEKIERFLTAKKKEITIDEQVAELKEKTKSFLPSLTIPLNVENSVRLQLSTVPADRTDPVAIPPTELDGAKVFHYVFQNGKPTDGSLVQLGEAFVAAGSSLTPKQKESLIAVLNKYSSARSGLEEALSRTDKLYKPGISLGTFPATWYQSVNALGIVVFAPVFAFLWVFLAARKIEPSTPVKFGIGLLLVSLSFIVMVPGAIEAKRTLGLAAPYWLVLSYVLATWGELCLSPVGLSMVSKLAPLRYASLLMGFWFISSAIANKLGGYMAALFGAESAESGELGLSFCFGQAGGLADFFLLMAIIPAITGIVVLLSAAKLKKMMHGAG